MRVFSPEGVSCAGLDAELCLRWAAQLDLFRECRLMAIRLQRVFQERQLEKFLELHVLKLAVVRS